VLYSALSVSTVHVIIMVQSFTLVQMSLALFELHLEFSDLPLGSLECVKIDLEGRLHDFQIFARLVKFLLQ
jgi:hypothetical protein